MIILARFISVLFNITACLSIWFVRDMFNTYTKKILGWGLFWVNVLCALIYLLSIFFIIYGCYVS